MHPDKTDGLPHGETAFFLPHQNLGPDRDDCPDECFAYPDEEPEDKEDGYKAPQKKMRKPNPRPRGPHPGFWFEHGKILLDPHNNPVKKHLDMPLTLSAETEGYKLQLMRLLNPDILQKDEWARMPRWIKRQVPKTDQMIIKYIGSPNTHINMPSQRFRDEKGTLAGNKRDGTKKIREGLKAFFAEHGFDPSLTGSTRGFGRDLLPWEQDQVKLGNTGKHPGRAGEARALDDETRNKNLQKTLKKIEKGRKKAQADAAKAGDAFGKRPRDEEEVLNEDANPAPQKRVYRKPGMIPSNIGIARNKTNSKLGGRSQKSRGKQGSSQTQRYGTHGAALSPYQNANTLEEYQQASSLIDSHFNRNREMLSYPGIVLETDARLDHLRQSRGQTETIRGPYIDGHLENQNAPGHVCVENVLTEDTNTPQQVSPGSIRSVPVNNDRHGRVPESTSDPWLFSPDRENHDPYSTRLHRAHNTNGVPIRDLSGFGVEPGGYVPSQTLGKRDRPPLESESQEDSLGPGGKRRRMPGTEGYNLPPGTQRRAEKKLRKSKRDERLPPPVFNVYETGQTSQQASQDAATLDIAEAVPTAYQSPQVADAQGPDLPFVPAPATAGQLSAPDIRDVPPATEWECERLKKALECTRWAYEQWTGMDAPHTNRNESYNTQFGVIYLAFLEWWSSRGNPERLNPAEWLVQLDPWEGTVADWKPPVTDGFFYECMRRGFYAPRNADGSLQRPEYRHNYQDYPWYNPVDIAEMR